MIRHIYRRRVRYRECDPMNVAYHTFYLDYFEEARTEALRDIGLPYKELEDSGIIMPVVEASVRYLAPARYDDMLEIETIFKEIPRVRVNISYTVRRENEDTLLATGTVVLCFIDTERGRPIPAPKAIRDAFSSEFSAEASGAPEAKA